jgi:hypothetical protein
VTNHSDFNARAKSALTGAQDLIGKPFLTFEITLKALTLVLRARVQKDQGRSGTAIGPGEVIGPKAESSPVEVPQPG